MGLYKGGLIYGWAYTWTIFCVSNKQVRHKQVGHKQGNKRVLSNDYWAYINWGYRKLLPVAQTIIIRNTANHSLKSQFLSQIFSQVKLQISRSQ